MKRVRPVNPVLPNVAREEVDLRSRARDSRRDPQATAKISREELEEALHRSSSGLRAAVRPETAQEPRTQSGERVAVRPPEEKVPSDRPTARPAAIEVGATHESESDRLAEQMYRDVQARVTPQVATHVTAPAPIPDVATTALAPIEPPRTAPAAVATTIPETPESNDRLADDDEPIAARVRRTRLIVSLVMLTIILATAAWYAGRYVGVLLQHS